MLDIEHRLEELKESGLYRRMRVVSGPQGPRVVLDGKPVLMLCSNNYLGLTTHPKVIEAAIAAGKSLFTEKPVCVDATGYRKVIAAGEEARQHPAVK